MFSSRFVDELIRDGSGEVEWLPGAAFAEVVLTPAQAHHDAGQPTELKRVVDGWVFIGEDKLRQAQLPDEVVTETGTLLRRPKHWM